MWISRLYAQFLDVSEHNEMGIATGDGVETEKWRVGGLGMMVRGRGTVGDGCYPLDSSPRERERERDGKGEKERNTPGRRKSEQA